MWCEQLNWAPTCKACVPALSLKFGCGVTHLGVFMGFSWLSAPVILGGTCARKGSWFLHAYVAVCEPSSQPLHQKFGGGEPTPGSAQSFLLVPCSGITQAYGAWDIIWNAGVEPRLAMCNRSTLSAVPAYLYLSQSFVSGLTHQQP